MARHHYIPQFYLKGFTDPDTPEAYKPYVWVYSLEKSAWQKRAPNNVARKSGYYTLVDESGEPTEELETELSHLEGNAARVIRSVLERREMRVEDCAHLATFVASMRLRVPATAGRINSAISEVFATILANDFEYFSANPEAFAAFKDESDLEDIALDDLNPEKNRIHLETSSVVALTLSPLKEVARIIARMKWVFAVAQPGDCFITSDSPFFMVDMKNNSQFYGDGLCNENIEVSLPLTQTVAFFATWGGDGYQYAAAPSSFVEQINIRSRVSAQRFLIAPKPAFPGSDKLELAGAEVT